MTRKKCQCVRVPTLRMSYFYRSTIRPVGCTQKALADGDEAAESSIILIRQLSRIAQIVQVSCPKVTHCSYAVWGQKKLKLKG